jgi:hypothetical protein
MTFLFFGAKSLKTTLPTLPMLPLEKLTHQNHVVILNAPRNIEVGLRNSFSKGDNSPQSLKAVFLCLSFFSWRIFALITFIMVVLFGQPLWLVSPLRDIANPFNTAAQCLATLRDGFTTLSKGITA